MNAPFGDAPPHTRSTFTTCGCADSPGSITTVHAHSPQGAIDQITMLALLSGVEMGWPAIQAYARRVIDVVVQLTRVGGRRSVSEILFRPSSVDRPQ